MRHLLPAGYATASWELFAGLMISGAQYHFDTATNAPDWDYHFTWESQKTKLLLGKGIRFDDNPMALNSPGHPTSGTLFYLASRSAGLSVSQSLLTTFTAALAWEVWWEYREVVGVNDLIMTSVGGMAMGEALWQLSELFAHGSDTTGHRIAAALLTGYAAFDPLRGGRRVGPRGPLDRNGLPLEVAHRLRLELGMETASSTPFDVSVVPLIAFDGTLMNIEGYGQPGTRARWIPHTGYSKLVLRVAGNLDGLTDLELRSQADYVQFHAQAVSPGPWGIDAQLGVGAYFEHRGVRLTHLFDQRASAAPAGLTLHVTTFLGPVTFQLDGAEYPSFALVTSLGLPDWSASHDVAELPSVLRNQGYYFGFAWVSVLTGTLLFGPSELTVTYKQSNANRIIGLDRYALTQPESHAANDAGQELTASLLLPTGIDNLRLRSSGRLIQLEGALDGVAGRGADWQVSAGVVLAY